MPNHSINNQPLARPLRSQLETAVKAARVIAEKGAGAALSQMAVADAKAPDYLTDEHKALRRRLRAHGRALGDIKAIDDTQGVQHLIWEVAYEHWHRMLFARFLAENGLLLWEPGAAVSLDDCEALTQETDPAMNLGAKTKWELAGKLAARMLPQVFKPLSPVFELSLAPEHQRALERLLSDLPQEAFQASDSLGWVYQFWQAKRKDEVNASEVKIGADELPAVTQLFTEPYMVDFLLHNSLGAWWVTRHPGTPCPVLLTYLRTLDDGTPAAGKFEGWPDNLKDFTLLDPCCGSGHFLVAAFLMLAPMRMVAEGLSAAAAVDAVLADNLHGLEIDPRCVEIAVFALALAAWRFPDENGDPLGVRAAMPAPKVACCGLKVSAKHEDWMALVPSNAPNAAYLRQEMRLLHANFAQAPLLGSLLDPARSLRNDLATSGFDTLRELLHTALAIENSASTVGQGGEQNDDSWDIALNAKGLLEAALLLGDRYHLVATNVPYLARGKQNDTIKTYSEAIYPNAKHDLANVFLERCFEMGHKNNAGMVQVVMPQNWLYLGRYAKQREILLTDKSIKMLIRLGSGAFETVSGEVVQAILLTSTNESSNEINILRGLDVSNFSSVEDKANGIQYLKISEISQAGQLKNPSAIISLETISSGKLLSEFATALSGCSAGDAPRFNRLYWEIAKSDNGVWRFHQGTVSSTENYGGQAEVIFWENERGSMWQLAKSVKHLNHAAQNWLRGKPNWKKPGVVVSQMGGLPATLYSGEIYDCNACAVVPNNPHDLPALWAYCESGEHAQAVSV